MLSVRDGRITCFLTDLPISCKKLNKSHHYTGWFDSHRLISVFQDGGKQKKPYETL